MGTYKPGQDGKKPWDELPMMDFLSPAEEKTQSFNTKELRRRLDERAQAQYDRAFGEGFNHNEAEQAQRYAPQQEDEYGDYEDYGEDAEYDDDEAEEAEAPRRRAHKADGAFAKLRRWLNASIVNRVIVIASCVVLVATVVLVAVLLSGGDGGKKVIDADAVEAEIPDNYVFVNPNEYAGTLLAKTDDAGQEYIKNTLFVGDSNFARMVMYNYLDYSNVIGVESMGVQGINSSKSVYFSGYAEPVTVVEAIKLMQPQRMVICYGTNNIAAKDTKGFIEAYGAAMDSIEAAYPYIDVIICAIPPLGASVQGTMLNQKTVDDYNLALIDFAKARGYSYLDTAEVLKGSDGYIKSNYIYTDGVHLTQDAFDMFFKYVRTHAHIAEDTRPKPLKDIPRQVAPPREDTGKKEFDPALVAQKATASFAAAGCTAGKLDGVTPTSWSFTVPKDALAGEEGNWANSLFEAYKMQGGKLLKGSGVVVGYTENDDGSYLFTVSMYTKACTTHEWENTGKKQEPTCELAGQLEQKCKNCGETQWVDDPEKPALGHDWQDVPDSEKPATCEAEGTKEQKCARDGCGRTQTVKIEGPLGHSWVNDGDPISDPTCTADGAQKQKCSRSGCTATQTVVLPALGHDYSILVETPQTPTCNTPGKGKYKCSRCDAITEKEIPATGQHVDGNGDGKCDACGTQIAPSSPPSTDSPSA